MKNPIIKNALLNATLTALYIIAVATFLTNAQTIFGPEEPKTVLVPVMMLLLFVISAAITGALVFGRPVMWYIDGKKQEALSLFGYTIGYLYIILLTAFVLLLVVS